MGGVAAAILADAAGGQGHGCEQKFPVNELLGVRRSIQSAADISSKTLQRPKTPRRVHGTGVADVLGQAHRQTGHRSQHSQRYCTMATLGDERDATVPLLVFFL
ncbi:unnamed protein product [Ectocarpus sp. 6 AP-2014]